MLTPPLLLVPEVGNPDEQPVLVQDQGAGGVDIVDPRASAAKNSTREFMFELPLFRPQPLGRQTRQVAMVEAIVVQLAPTAARQDGQRGGPAGFVACYIH